MPRTAQPKQPGTRSCYLAGCRHPECAEANRLYMRRYRGGKDPAAFPSPPKAENPTAPGQTDMGSAYLDCLEAVHRESPVEACRREAVEHRSMRPCPAGCGPMDGGKCPRHGRPAEDGGGWLVREWSA